jgi:hypothetical protein
MLKLKSLTASRMLVHPKTPQSKYHTLDYSCFVALAISSNNFTTKIPLSPLFQSYNIPKDSFGLRHNLFCYQSERFLDRDLSLSLLRNKLLVHQLFYLLTKEKREMGKV